MNNINYGEAIKPVADEMRRIIREHGDDRPDHQLQPLMISMGDCKRFLASLANRPADDGELERMRRALAITQLNIPGSVDDQLYIDGWFDGQMYLSMNQKAEAGLPWPMEDPAPPQPEGARCPLCDAIHPQPHLCERRGISHPATYDAPRDKEIRP